MNGGDAVEVPAFLAPRFEPIENIRAHEHVAEQLRRQIRLHLIPVGSALPPERELAAMFGVGRATVAAAIQLLEADELVVTKRGRNGGTFASERTPDSLSYEYLEVRVRRERDRIQQAMTFRGFVEPISAREAARNRTDKEVAHIERACDHIVPGDSPISFLAGDSILHLLIAHASHNMFLVETVEQIRVLLNEAFAVLGTDGSLWRDTRDEHKEIVRAVKDRDEDQAEAAMAKHLALTQERIVELLRDV
ncbi:MAG TPA: FCD domain-containing protein [Solirubrobacterales bacterium]|nr:FCD domain-containing protein [Solirubrobacterales bacterium]